MALAAAILYALVLLGALGVLIAKGRTFTLAPLWLLAVLLCGLPILIVAFALADPDSPWARRFYGPEKLSRARERAPSKAQMAAERNTELRAEWGEHADIAGQDRITRRALKKAGYTL